MALLLSAALSGAGAGLVPQDLALRWKKGLLGEEQGGLHVGRGCPDQLFILTEVLAGRRQLGRKAYDRVWRDGLLKALWQKGVRGRPGLGGSSAATTRT